jgi:hypothetical protein
MKPSSTLSDSAFRCFRDCRKKYELRYERGLSPIAMTAPALHFGKLFHGAIAEWSIARQVWNVHMWLLEQNCREDDRRYVGGMVAGYVKKYADSTPPLLCEVEFRNLIRNPSTGRRSQRFEQYGFMDALAPTELQLWERKTTSSIGQNLEKLWSDSQITGYVVALRDAGINVRTVVYDEIQKTKIRQKKGETQDEFWARRDAVYLDNPDMYHREEVFVSDRQIADWRRDIWQVTQDILSCRRTGHWYRNTSRCHDFYRTCEYAPLCQSGESPALIASKYQPRKSPANVSESASSLAF